MFKLIIIGLLFLIVVWAYATFYYRHYLLSKPKTLVMTDPRYLNIPNINFSQIYDASFEDEFAEQRNLRGFDDSETWSLNNTVAKFIVPRLQRFKELVDGCPPNLSTQEWMDILDTMIDGFTLAATEDKTKTYDESELRIKSIQQAVDLFAKYYLNLWW